VAQANGYEALFQSFSKQNWFAGGFAWKWYVDDYYKKRILIILTGKTSFRNTKKWYK
jgi:hypothetical protein